MTLRLAPAVLPLEEIRLDSPGSSVDPIVHTLSPSSRCTSPSGLRCFFQMNHGPPLPLVYSLGAGV